MRLSTCWCRSTGPSALSTAKLLQGSRINDSTPLAETRATPHYSTPAPAVAGKRLSLTPNGNVRYELKTPYRDGTTHVIFEPLDFIGKLAALVPPPRANLTRFHGVFAPNRSAAEVTKPKAKSAAVTAGIATK